MREKIYTVSETVELTGIPSHVLRYWEEELGIAVARTAQGHRVYTVENVETFRRVKELKTKGLQLKAIRILLEAPEISAEHAGFRAQLYNIANALPEEDDSECIRETFDDENLQEEKITENITAEYESEERFESCEVILHREEKSPLDQLTDILKQLMEETADMQNRKLEQILTACIREELEEYGWQYLAMLKEAAVTEERVESDWKSRRPSGVIRRILERIMGK